MSLSTTGECVTITIGMHCTMNNGNPVIKRIGTEAIMAETVLEVGMDVTSISYDGECAFVMGDTSNKNKKTAAAAAAHPFLDKKSKIVPGTEVTAVVHNNPEEDIVGNNIHSSKMFLIRGVAVSSQSYNKGSRQVEVLVHTIEDMDDDVDTMDDVDDNGKKEGPESEDESTSDDFSSVDDSIEEIPLSLCSHQPNKDSFAWRSPPLGLPGGGYWTTQKYIGRNTMVTSFVGLLCLGFVGPMVLCCPFDERAVYIVDGKVYIESGKHVGYED